MATYIIGDVQGCFETLQKLLDKIAFEPTRDTLWFCGDLVNRGPASLETLRFVKALPRKVTVLGNHDLHCLAYGFGVQHQRTDDTLKAIMQAPDKDELLHWLRQQPLLHHDPAANISLVHAGIYPLWDLAQARLHAQSVETLLRGPDFMTVLQHMYGNQPSTWQATLSGPARWRFIINSFTRMRLVNDAAALMLNETGPPAQYPNLHPWYAHPQRLPTGPVAFGHWSALGYFAQNGVYCLDSGCVWGGPMSALRLTDKQCFQQHPY